jgi:surface polysaccharide O-acyltransferase-like enzyme
MRTLLSVSPLPVSYSVDSLAIVAPQTDVEAHRPKQRLPDHGATSAGARNHPTSDYLFVSNVRFLAMISIVWVHTVGFWGTATTSVAYLQVIVIQVMKFGTIGFFLISGYLLGEGLTRTSPSKYFYRRVKAVLVPWIFWSCVWFAFAMFQDPLLGGGLRGLELSLHELAQKYLTFVFLRSAYWFIPNFFFCLALVLALYRRVPDYLQGAIFVACSVFYGVNVYLKVIPEGHTSALFGFVLYLWLGLIAHKYREVWGRWLEKISWGRLSIYAGVAVIFALGEIHALRKLGTADEYNTLRLSNQAFSVLVVMLIVKCKRPLFPRAIDVRGETFGIFLIHSILWQLFMTLRDRILDATRLEIRGMGVLPILMGLATVATIYLLSLLLTKLLRRVPYLTWTIGR